MQSSIFIVKEFLLKDREVGRTVIVHLSEISPIRAVISAVPA